MSEFSGDRRLFTFNFAGMEIMGEWSPFLIYNGDRAHLKIGDKTCTLGWLWGRDGWRFEGLTEGMPSTISAERTPFGYAGTVWELRNSDPHWPSPTRDFFAAVVQAAISTLTSAEKQSRAAIIAAGRLGPDGHKDKDELYLKAVIPFWLLQRDTTFQNTRYIGGGSVGMSFHQGKNELDAFLGEWRQLKGRDWQETDAANIDIVCAQLQWPSVA